MVSTSDSPASLPSVSINNSRLEFRTRALSQTVANNVFDIKHLYPVQLDMLARIAMMKFKLSSYKTSPLLFVHPTGSGKSLARDVRSVIFRGVSLTIVPALSLGADLAVNIRQKVF